MISVIYYFNRGEVKGGAEPQSPSQYKIKHSKIYDITIDLN